MAFPDHTGTPRPERRADRATDNKADFPRVTKIAGRTPVERELCAHLSLSLFRLPVRYPFQLFATNYLTIAHLEGTRSATETHLANMIIITVLARYPDSRAVKSVAVFAENSIRFDQHFRSHAESVALREGEGEEGVNRGSLFAAGFRCILRSGGAVLNFPNDGRIDRQAGAADGLAMLGFWCH